MRQDMKTLIKFFFVCSISFACFNNKSATEESRGANNLAYKWGKVALQATANDTEKFKPRPTVTSRILGLIWTAVFDAWSRYDAKAGPFTCKM